MCAYLHLHYSISSALFVRFSGIRLFLSKRTKIFNIFFILISGLIISSCSQNVVNPVQVPDIPKLSSPSDGATNQSTTLTLSWNASNGASSYNLQVSVSNSFTNIFYNQNTITGTSQQVTGLSGSKTYYWRLSASNNQGSSNWSTVWSFYTVSGVGQPCAGFPTVAYSGKTYNTVQVGNQCWLKENLDVGTRINSMANPSNNGTIEKYCYDNYSGNCDTYGGLYQWNEAMGYSTTPGTQGICPTGWHIPTYAEFEALMAAVNNDCNSLKSIGQGTGSGQGTNTSGFSALLSGFQYSPGFFNDLGHYAGFWSSTEAGSGYADGLGLIDGDSNGGLGAGTKEVGLSVRCLKD